MRNITEEIEELQRENQQLKELKKLFEKAVKVEFGMSVKEIHSIVDARGKKQSILEQN